MGHNAVTAFLFVVLLSLISCASQPADDGQSNASSDQQFGLDPSDPWEGYNRKIFTFNEWFDDYVTRPIAIGYDTITPNVMQAGVRNFFSNLGEVYSLVNNLVQLDFEGASTSLMRFSINSTLGLFGLIDIATEVGMRKDQEDFGQTLGRWGIGSGNYLMLPFFGPSGTRDVFSYVDWSYYDRYQPLDIDRNERNGLTLLSVAQLRADLLDLEDQIPVDKYTFIRDVYRQRRDFLVNDGVVDDDGFANEEDLEVSDDDF